MEKIIFVLVLATSGITFAEDKEALQVIGEKVDREGIRKTFLNHNKDLAGCYNNILKQAQETAKRTNKEMPNLSGKLVLDFSIGEDGLVEHIQVDPKKSTLSHRKLEGCIAKLAYSWQFPKPPSGQTVQVFYPMSFSSK